VLVDIVEVKPLPAYRLFLRFEDGVHGEVDISQVVPFQGVFAKLRDQDYFSMVKVNPDTGTICWDNGADIAPCTLYRILVG
jgi:hypothetical protein